MRIKNSRIQTFGSVIVTITRLNSLLPVLVFLLAVTVGTSQTTYSYRLMDAANNTTAISSFAEDITWNLQDANSINIVSNLGANIVHQVRFTTSEHTQTEGMHPYAYRGDYNDQYGLQNGVYYGWSPTVGTLTFTVEYLDSSSAVLTTDTFTITFIDQVPSGSSNYVKRVNCGKSTAGLTVFGQEFFSPDIPATEGFEFTASDNKSTSGHSNFTLGGIFNPSRYTDSPSMQYEFPVTESGNYRVQLYFAEPWHGPGLSGQPSNFRRFNIDIENGQFSQTDYAIFEEAGNVANNFVIVDQTVQVTDGKVTIALTRGSGNDPLINAIAVEQIDSNTNSGTATAIRINAGGPTVTTSDNKTFDADQYFTGGTAYANTSAVIDPLYQTERSGTAKNFTYNITVDNGDYDVILHFAEIYWGATGGGTGGTNKRLFDVSIENSQVLDDYDIYAEVGAQTPVTKSYPVTISDGEVTIAFSSLSAVGGVDQVKLSAIEVVPSGSSGGDGGSTSGNLWTKNSANDNIYYNTGDVGIGTVAIANYKLAVDGSIRSREVKVDNQSWPDYVFESDYELPELSEVQRHIKAKGHLINIPSAKEVEANGVALGEMNKLLLEKIEELTLYILQQEKRIQTLEQSADK